ncbi:MAG: hypothetical protein ACFFD2_21220 [Promethearchaeota archaeon]
MCEFQIFVSESGKKETLITDDISFLRVQEDGSILLRGLGIQDKIHDSIIKEVNTYAEDGATAKLFKSSIIGYFMKFLKLFETGSYSPELEKKWIDFVKKGKELIEKMKKK